MLTIQKPKLGTTKIIIKVVNIDNLCYLTANAVDIDFTGFKVKSITTIYEHLIDFKSESYDSDVFLMIQEFKDILKEKGIIKSIFILNFMSNNMFYDSVSLPKLSNAETVKSLNLEIKKLYPDYENRFVYDSVKFTPNKHTVTYNYAFIEYKRYEKILKWFKDARINISYVTLNEDSVKRALNKYNFFKKKNTLFINMSYYYTELYNYEGKRLDGYRLCPEGYNKVLIMASKLFDISLEEAKYKMETNSLPEGEYLKEFSKEIKFLYSPLLLEIKRMIGGFDHEKGIEAIYLNFENTTNDFLYDNLQKVLKIEFTEIPSIKKNILFQLSSYGAYIRQNKLTDYIFPVRLKSKLNEQKR